MARPPQITRQALVPLLMARGPVSATDLAAALRVDRSTIARALSSAFGDELATFGATRSTRYLLRRPVLGAGDRWPVYVIDETGRARHWATVESYHDRRWRVTWPDAMAAPAWAAPYCDALGLWDGFPFFLADVRPQGFLGRAIARRITRLLGVPEDPRQWSDDHTLLYLQAAGEDLPGSLVIGEDCLRRALAPIELAQIVPESDRAGHYPRLAGESMTSLPGSSAGGEQPKFLTHLAAGDSPSRAVLVKFSPPLDQTTGRRWADLLACEWLALQVLSEQGLARPGTRLLDAGGRRFLEVPRFDRTPGGGRLGVVSLFALCPEADSHGIASAWPRSTAELEQRGFIDAATRAEVARLHAFGELIGNSDMHGGNLAFWLGDSLPFRLAPAYDMLPMLWSPGPQGEISERTFAPAPPLPGNEENWRAAAGWAADFWSRATESPDLSNPFRQIARDAAETLRRLRDRMT
jgi:hypothetical protein